ncbi:MAG: hypothetical protein ABSD44_04735 [Terracidiphilus sp.]
MSGSTLTAVTTGTCSVTASQAGNSAFTAALPITVTFSIGGDSQTITFGTVPALNEGDTETLTATASSGLTVSFTASPSSVCTVSGTTLTGVGPGTCTVTASQAGNSTYAAAASVPQTLTVSNPTLSSQTITFGTVPGLAAPGTETLTATASSGLTVSFTASPSSVCTVSGATLTGAGSGTCTVTASQAGDAAYTAAPSVQQNLTVTGSSAPPPVNLSSGFTGSPAATADGGSIDTYSGSSLDAPPAYSCTGGPAECGSGSGGGASSYFYVYYQTTEALAGTTSPFEYVGLSIFAPGVSGLSATGNTSGVSLSGQTSISFAFNSNAEWVTADGTPNVLVQLTMGDLYNPTPTTTCNIQLRTVFAATGGATGTPYTIPLANFNVTNNCGDSTMTVGTALTQPISEIDFQGDGGGAAVTINGVASNSNLTTANTAVPPVYPTTIALGGPITFQ